MCAQTLSLPTQSKFVHKCMSTNASTFLCAACMLLLLKIWSEMYNQPAKSHTDFQAMLMKSPALECKVIVFMT